MRSKTLCIAAAAALPTAAAEARISCVLTDFLLGSLDILMMDVGLYSSGLHFWLNLWYTTKRDAAVHSVPSQRVKHLWGKFLQHIMRLQYKI